MHNHYTYKFPIMRTSILFTLTLGCLTILALFFFTGCTTSPEDDAESSTPIEAPSSDARLDGLITDGKEASETTKRALTHNAQDYTAQIAPEFQLPELPSGCEIVALTIALRAYGFDLSKTELAEKYLTITGSEWGFLASPFEDSGGGFPPGIVQAANAYLADQGSLLHAHDLTGSSFEALCALSDAGIPVCVWTTLSLTPPNYDPALGGTDTWFINEHCVVLYGTSEDNVLVANPLEGLQTQDASLFSSIYDQCGSMALAIY